MSYFPEIMNCIPNVIPLHSGISSSSRSVNRVNYDCRNLEIDDSANIVTGLLGHGGRIDDSSNADSSDEDSSDEDSSDEDSSDEDSSDDEEDGNNADSSDDEDDDNNADSSAMGILPMIRRMAIMRILL